MKKLIPLFALFLSPLATASITDCPIIQENGVVYDSHGDFIEAYTGMKQADIFKYTIEQMDAYTSDYNHRKILWHTTLLSPNKVHSPFIESDSVVNTTCLKYATNEYLMASDHRNHRFELDKKTGKLLKSYNYQLMLNSNIADKFDGFLAEYGDSDILQKMVEFKLTGDYAMLTKRIDYVNDSMMMVFVNKKSATTTYDITLSLPNTKTYILNNIAKDKIGQLFTDFANNKPIDTTNWQVIDTEKLTQWYDKNYIAKRQTEFSIAK